MRGTADGEHADATPIDLQPDPTPSPSPSPSGSSTSASRLSDRPGVGQHVEQDAGVTPANERDPEPEPGFGLAIIGVGVGFYVGHGLAVPDGFGVRVVVAELSGGHRLRLPRRVHRGEPGQQPASSASRARPADQPELCVSVQRSQASISRGQQAAYVVRVSTENNGSAADVTVALTAQPSGQKPTFTSGCAKGAGTASCTVSAVSDKQPVSLKAQIPVAAGATSVTSVKLTATASVVTTEKWTPPSAAETVAVTAASASPAKSPAGSSPAGVPPGGALPLGPIPNLNGVSSQLIGAGNAAGLFPAINPSATPSPSPGSPAPGSQRRPAPDSSAIAFVQPGLTGQVAGLIALAVAVMLTVTRLSLRKRFRSRKQGG